MMPADPPLVVTIRAGLDLSYYASAPTPIILLIKPRLDRWQHIEKEQLSCEPQVPMEEYEDEHGNIVQRFVLPIGQTTVRHDMFVAVPAVPENHGAVDGVIPIAELPAKLLRYTLPSRYCDSDKLLDFAFQQFGQVAHGLERVQAICDWVHQNIEYRWGAGSPHTSASEIIKQRFGVCRDFAHTAIALCRTFNLPARYVTGYVPDVGYLDPGTPMDFHAYFQVFLGGRWQTFDARFNVPRIGRIRIACGLDAVDGAFSTLYGAANLVRFEVWGYQVDPDEVNLGDPVDLSKRLCGTRVLRFPKGQQSAATTSGLVETQP
jgi:transglutaminase-like putative cysteine protease